MTKAEFEQLTPNFSVVYFAGSNYIVADKRNNFGADLVGIYDEFPTNMTHIDWLNADSQSVIYNSNRGDKKRIF